jgi:hypothetical protein
MDKVRVLRVIEYVGPRAGVEAHLKRAKGDGTHLINVPFEAARPNADKLEIRVATIGSFPEVLEQPGGWRGEVGQ